MKKNNEIKDCQIEIGVFLKKTLLYTVVDPIIINKSDEIFCCRFKVKVPGINIMMIGLFFADFPIEFFKQFSLILSQKKVGRLKDKISLNEPLVCSLFRSSQV